MKLLKFMAAAALAMGFAACDSDDGPDNPVQPQPVSNVVYVINQGNMYANISGSITSLDLENGKSFQNAFQTANGRVLGDTPQSAMVYGSKLYVAVCESNVIEITDKSTLTSLKSIALSGEGTSPRYFVADGGYVYVSLYDGYVARIDTATMAIDKKVKVGPNPEQLAVVGNYLYCANSDGMNFDLMYADGKTVSKIDLSTMTVEKNIAVGINPTQIKTDGTDLYVLCMGDYWTIPAAVSRVTTDGVVTELCKATMIDFYNGNLYCANAPFNAEKDFVPEYFTYNVKSNSRTDLDLKNIYAPQAIAVNPTNGEIFVSSYGDGGDYSTPFIVNQYRHDGTFVDTYNVGIGAFSMCFQ